MARRYTSINAPLHVEGMDLVIDKMEKIIAATSGGAQGAKLKQVYVEAAKINSRQVRANIQKLNASGELRQVLSASVVTNEGKESQSNAISQINQPAAVRRIGDSLFVPNPYWFEYGTVPRATGKGANRGMIKPTPFFRPAVQQSKARVIESLTNGLKRLIGI